MANVTPPYHRYWGKTHVADGGEITYHPLVWHCLDVAAVGETLLRRHSSLPGRLSAALGLAPDVTRRLAAFFLALHDLGNFRKPSRD